MRRLLSTMTALLSCAAALLVASTQAASAQSVSSWMVFIRINTGSLGTSIGVMPWGYDDYPGTGDMIQIDPRSKGILMLRHYTHGENWTGPTGFTPEDIRRVPLTPGEVRTWSDMYVWAQNMTPPPDSLCRVSASTDPYRPPPAGYRAHLVLDYVPQSCNWAGRPTDYWFDLTTTTTFALPIPVVTNPLQGTRFHLDVYAPVPEPSSVATFAFGVAGAGVLAARRRKV